ncbi:MAG: WecB/TagA/CpsF family glycosyltransferase [Burkholderiales bacterium]
MSAPRRNRRDVVGILGLPFDAVTMDDAVARVRAAIVMRRPLFVSTPNLNFVIGCQDDAAFRGSVLASDLSVADGMPVVWMSRLLGTPLPERVTGSGLFERLRDDPLPSGHRPIRVYFYGGPPGAAAAAATRLAARSTAMTCVGHASPGFGSVEELSDDATIAAINDSGADFLVVALGAAKGQAWILRNRARLAVPVISHLGAVVNFEAGTVSRAPAWVQRTGLEWLWRIKEEPALWRRYGRDAAALARLCTQRLVPHLLWRLRHRPGRNAAGPVVWLRMRPDGCGLRIGGSIPDAVPANVDDALATCTGLTGPVELDLTEVDYFGPRFAGRLLRLGESLARQGRTLTLHAPAGRARSLFEWSGLAAAGRTAALATP